MVPLLKRFKVFRVWCSGPAGRLSELCSFGKVFRSIGSG